MFRVSSEKLASYGHNSIVPADEKTDVMIVCTVWQGPTHSEVKDRHVLALPEALQMAQEALGRGYLVTLYPKQAQGSQAAAIREVAA